MMESVATRAHEALHPGIRSVLDEVGEAPPAPFEAAPFQRWALAALEHGDVLVAAPTGSGKTWIAERAMAQVLTDGGSAWYTTPLKALSNQKFRKFGALYGETRVGLLTGERKINAAAPVIVATTEILRNALYEQRLAVHLVVLDEAHYLSDPERGTAWEEIILLAPPTARLLLLSATMPNTGELAEWMGGVRGRPPAVIREEQRPVPLRLLLADVRGHLLPVRLADRIRGRERTRGWLSGAVRELDRARLLPAILFFPARRECDHAARELGALRFPGEAERAEALAVWEREFPHLRAHAFRGTLVRSGVAPHHAGHLTAWRLAVEDLLDRGLVRAVAATTTLASGLDVPARTVLLSTLVRQSDQGPVSLSATEFHQMSGRAGRRGRDLIGVVVLPATSSEEAVTGVSLAEADPEPIRSAFSATYGQVLNLLLRRTLEEALAEVGRSFAAWERERGLGVEDWEARRVRTSRPGAIGRLLHRFHDPLSRQFLVRAMVLEDLGYLAPDGALTEAGRWAAELRHHRLLVLAELVRANLLPRNPVRLAAWAAALGTERAPRAGAEADLGTLASVVRAVAEREASYGLEADPLAQEFAEEWDRLARRTIPSPADRRASAIEAWARGADWGPLAAGSRAEEGDLQRTVLQAAEILMQLEGLPQAEVRTASREARARLLRTPVV